MVPKLERVPQTLMKHFCFVLCYQSYTACVYSLCVYFLAVLAAILISGSYRIES